MPKCVSKFCACASLRSGCVLVSVYLIIRGLVALTSLVYLMSTPGNSVTKGVLWGAIFGLLVGPRLLYVTLKNISRPLKNTAVWLVIYGIVDLAVFTICNREWNRRNVSLALGFVVELVLFFYFSLVLWSQGVTVTGRKPLKREKLRMAVLKECQNV